ncbi:MAG TPA: Sua5/YciO/YrdC/YwlC family protein [Solirubrobacteraceae bacterium]|nr:Sua5/YciO/YrdC/YwlC family protein [Solirubrobacteraceae bacterium]
MTEFERVIEDGGVVVFPSDTVYGLACDPENAEAIVRLYALKGRPADKAAAIMFFDLEAALAAIPELGPRTQAALRRLMPGAITALLANSAGRFPLASRNDRGTLGLRVVSVPALAGVRIPVLQSSANPAGGAEARSLSEVAPAMRAGADLVIDGGELPGVASTVVDLRDYENQGTWSVLRRGAVDEDVLAAALGGRFRFDPSSYAAMVIDALPGYERLQQELVAASGSDARRILDLGIGTGETSVRLLERHPEATLFGIDESPTMLAAAVERLGRRMGGSRVGLLQEPLPTGEFDLVASALAIHHLDGEEKADLFQRLRRAVAPGGRFVLGDVIVPEDPAVVVTDRSDGYDKPSTIAEQLEWLRAAGFEASLAWSENDLAVLVATVAG